VVNNTQDRWMRVVQCEWSVWTKTWTVVVSLRSRLYTAVGLSEWAGLEFMRLYKRHRTAAALDHLKKWNNGDLTPLCKCPPDIDDLDDLCEMCQRSMAEFYSDLDRRCER